MTPDELFEQAWDLIFKVRPSTDAVYLLYANDGRLCVCELHALPHTAWTIKAFDFTNITNGFSYIELHRIRVMINFLSGIELLI